MDLPYAVTSFGPRILTPDDRVFGQLGRERRIEMFVAAWLPLPFVVEATELVGVGPERLSAGYWYARDRLADPAHECVFARLDESVAHPRPGER